MRIVAKGRSLASLTGLLLSAGALLPAGAWAVSPQESSPAAVAGQAAVGQAAGGGAAGRGAAGGVDEGAAESTEEDRAAEQAVEARFGKSIADLEEQYAGKLAEAPESVRMLIDIAECMC